MHPSVCPVKIELEGAQMQLQDCKSFGLNQCKSCRADAAAAGNVVCLPGVILSGSLPSVMEGPLLLSPFCHWQVV